MSAVHAPGADTEFPDWCLHTGKEPMPETSLHAYFSNLIVSAIRWILRDRQDVFVTTNFAWYPELRNSKDPDVLVVFGRPNYPRSSWRNFREDGVAPQIVFEIKSESNTLRHIAEKRQWYDQHGVEEYYDYDPERGTFTAWARSPQSGRLEQVAPSSGFKSPRLNLTFVLNGQALEIVGPDGRVLGDYVAAEHAAEVERANAEVARADAEAERANAEGARADAEAERRRADEAIAELAELRARLGDR